jgi:hypothetical protein
MAIPYFDFVAEREQLKDWSMKKEEKGLEEYWEQHNQTSIDGKPTNIMTKNT